MASKFLSKPSKLSDALRSKFSCAFFIQDRRNALQKALTKRVTNEWIFVATSVGLVCR